MNPYALFHGDCLNIMPLIKAGSVDLVVADLPYGVTNCAWDSVIPLDRLWAEYKRVLKPGGAVVLTAQQPFTTALINSNPKWFRYAWVWDKARVTGWLNAKKQPLRRHEDILVFYERQPTYNPQWTQGQPYVTSRSGGAKIYGAQKGTQTTSDGRRYPVTVLAIPQLREKGGHPTQKPVELMEYLIATYSNPDELVLDNTAGHFSTGVAALNQGRRFVGIERDADYFRVGRIRMEVRAAELGLGAQAIATPCWRVPRWSAMPAGEMSAECALAPAEFSYAGAA